MTEQDAMAYRSNVERAALLRDEFMPLPNVDEGFPRTLLVGTTGAGKTTLVRQLIGTDPERERFPSTSSAKTTVADTEIVVDPGAATFRAVVTFVSRAEVVAALQECFVQVALGVLDRRRESELMKRMLEHPEQRFRFQYVFGNVRGGEATAPDADDDRERIERSREIVTAALEAIRTFVTEIAEDIEADLRGSDIEAAHLREEVEAEIEQLVGTDEVLVDHLEALIDDMRGRFELVTQGNLELVNDWPVRWSWEESDRSTFIEGINFFSSNHAARFGRLLTPFVNGIRVRGPFVPHALPAQARGFSLVDVEGLGHTPDSSASVSPRLVEYFDAVDAILLVDNGQQPMQAASIAAIRAIITSGHIDKLVVAFTHLDQVIGDNLTSIEEREEHVLSSAENVVIRLGADLPPRDEQRLRNRVDGATVLLGGIDRRLQADEAESGRTRGALRELCELLCHVPVPIDPSEARPTYNREDFEEATHEAIATFRRRWKGLLGREDVPGTPKEHWARVKALTRRLGELDQEEYGDLKPIADLVRATREAFYDRIRRPLAWHPIEPPEANRDEIMDRFATELSSELGRIAQTRVWRERRRRWIDGYAESGKGSTYARAEIIDLGIFEEAAPLGGTGDYASDVIKAVAEVSTRAEIQLL